MGKPTTRQRFLARADKVLRVAIYLRVSTAAQVQGYGLQTQNEMCHDTLTVKMRGQRFVIVDTYTDAGVSGKKASRPQFDRMNQDIADGKIDVVVVAKVDRIGRTMEDIHRWVFDIDHVGIRLITADGRLDNADDTFKLMLSLLAWMADTEHLLILERTTGGREAKLHEGGWVGGGTPFGFMLEGKGATAKPVANPAEVEILELAIGSIVDHDMTVKEAADSLNNLGKVNRHGGKWEQSNLRQILLGNALLGFMAFRDEEANGSRANAARDEETGEYLHGDTGRVSLPEIIPLERIKAVRAALTRRGPQRHREAGMYLLSKRLFGLCGNYYSGAVKTHNDRRSYRCTGTLSSHKNYVGCGCTEIDADEVERVVWQTVSEGFRDRGHLQDLADQWLGAVPLLATGYRERIAELEELLERKRKSRKKRLVTLLALADDDDDFDAEMLADVKAELKNQETKIEKELNQVRGWLADAEVQEQRVADVLTLADRVRPDLDSLTEMQMLDALTLFDIGVHVRSRVERRAVKPTEFETWFKGSGLLVPAVLSDESWAAVVDLFPPARGTKPQRSRREILDAVFYKVRHGLSWPEMPEEFTAVESIKVLATKLLRDGSLPEAVQRLQGFGGTPPPSLNPLPDLHIEASFMERRPDPSNLTMECVTEGPSRVTFAEVLHREYVTAAS